MSTEQKEKAKEIFASILGGALDITDEELEEDIRWLELRVKELATPKLKKAYNELRELGIY